MSFTVSKEPTKVSEVFAVAQEILSDPANWSKNAWARSGSNHRLDWTFSWKRDHRVKKVCLGGACLWAADDNNLSNDGAWGWERFANVAAGRMGYSGYPEANDRGGYGVALEVLKLAQSMAEEDEAFGA